MPLVFPFILEHAYMYTFSELFEGQLHHDPLPLLRNVSGYEWDAAVSTLSDYEYPNNSVANSY